MAGRIFVTADLHLGDPTILQSKAQGRPFRTLDEMAEEIVERWNRTVGPEDTVYILGDIGRGRHLQALEFLRGTIHLIAGNNDDLCRAMRSGVFRSIMVAKWLPGALLTHIPVHPSQLSGKRINVHGHLHTASLNDARYACVSVQQTDYCPVSLSQILEQFSL